MIEKSDLTAMAEGLPEVLETMTPKQRTGNDNNEIPDLGATHKTDSLVEFMEIESQIKHASLKSIDG